MHDRDSLANGYQIRTRQYSNMNLQEYPQTYPFENQSNFQKYYELKSPDRYAKPSTLESYNRSDSYNWSQPLNPNSTGTNQRLQRRDHAQKSSQAANNRREGSRKQELEMRMQNINSINDKINNLLNLVKKERVYLSKERDDQTPPKFQRTPLPNRQIAAHFERRQQKIQPKANDTLQEYQFPKKNNKSLQRLRVLSTLEPNLIANQPKSKQKTAYNQFSRNNEEDYPDIRRDSGNKNYTPLKKTRNDSIQNLGRYQHFEQNTFESSKSNKYGNTLSPTHAVDRIRQNGLITQKYSHYGERNITPTKYNHQSIRDNYENSNRAEPLQSYPSRSNFESNYLPITLVNNERPSETSAERPYSGYKIVDNQLKRIRQKMGEFHGVPNTRERLEATPSRKQLAGTVSNSKEKLGNSGKSFELKVYPVRNDRPETVKIAEKLCFQIEADSRMKVSREAFLKMKGQQKWKELSDNLGRMGIRWTPKDLKQLIKDSSAESYSTSSPEQGSGKKIAVFAQQFADSQKFWEKNVIGCVSLKALRREGFDGKQLDSNKKGYLDTEDIVAFVNEYTAHSYKAKDIGLIFGRLKLFEGSVSEGLEYSTFMQAFTQ